MGSEFSEFVGWRIRQLRVANQIRSTDCARHEGASNVGAQ